MSLWSGALQSLLLGLSTVRIAQCIAHPCSPLVAGTDNISEKRQQFLHRCFYQAE